jgi:tetratricopeptide (TPR) repeat protein
MISLRLEALQKFLEEDPTDPFNWYALALEYAKSDREKALILFEKLLADFDQYIPTYYHAAHLYLQLGQTEKAIQTFQQGIAKAGMQNDLKAVKEMKSALDELMF